jgi:thioredoxin 1
MARIIQLNNENFKEEVLESKIPVLVDFWAPWCGPCLMMGPVLEELSVELDGRLRIAKLNTELPEHRDLVMRYQIQSIPNMKLFKDGRVIKEFIGLRPKEFFQSELEAEL